MKSGKNVVGGLFICIELLQTCYDEYKKINSQRNKEKRLKLIKKEMERLRSISDKTEEDHSFNIMGQSFFYGISGVASTTVGTFYNRKYNHVSPAQDFEKAYVYEIIMGVITICAAFLLFIMSLDNSRERNTFVYIKEMILSMGIMSMSALSIAGAYDNENLEEKFMLSAIMIGTITLASSLGSIIESGSFQLSIKDIKNKINKLELERKKLEKEVSESSSCQIL